MACGTSRFSRCTRPATHRKSAEFWGLCANRASASGIRRIVSSHGSAMLYLARQRVEVDGRHNDHRAELERHRTTVTTG